MGGLGLDFGRRVQYEQISVSLGKLHNQHLVSPVPLLPSDLTPRLGPFNLRQDIK